MSFDFHPILEAGDSIRRGQWYVVSPEGPKSSQAPCQRVGACANYVKSEDGGGKILISAGAAPQGLCCDLHQLLITKGIVEIVSDVSIIINAFMLGHSLMCFKSHMLLCSA